jgi:hypothetical protein
MQALHTNTLVYALPTAPTYHDSVCAGIVQLQLLHLAALVGDRRSIICLVSLFWDCLQHQPPPAVSADILQVFPQPQLVTFCVVFPSP